MKYISEFRNTEIAKNLISQIQKLSTKKVNLMEVCGTHTVAIFRYGIRNVLPKNINLISGPGCPVCVTSQEDIDKIIELTKISNLIITTFGDMMKVPGSNSSLEKEKSKGKDIRIVYSPQDAINIARENKEKDIVFVGIGFETTSPLIASCVMQAEKMQLSNFYLFVSHKTVPPAIRALANMGETKIDGFILPGHVSTVIGSTPYNFIADDFKIPSVISGFEPVDILQSIYLLLKQIQGNYAKVEIQYTRAVKEEGNKKAIDILYNVFETSSAMWRGIGEIEGSGLKLKNNFKKFDILNKYKIEVKESKHINGCKCGEILRGVKSPHQCKLFNKICTPENPIGPCMVSTEGTCSAYYKYGLNIANA